MVFCSKCGAENRDDAQFCFKCGTPFEAPKELTIVDEREKPTYQSGTWWFKNGTLALIAGVVIGAVGFIVYIIQSLEVGEAAVGGIGTMILLLGILLFGAGFVMIVSSILIGGTGVVTGWLEKRRRKLE